MSRIIHLTGSSLAKDPQFPAVYTPASTGGAPYGSALVQALDAAGGIQALARNLRVPKKQLTSWIEGDAELPHVVLLRALDFVKGRQRK